MILCRDLGPRLRDSLDMDATLTTPLHTGARSMAQVGPYQQHSGHFQGWRQKQWAQWWEHRSLQPKVSSDSCEVKTFLQEGFQSSICFHATLQHFLPCSATCHGAGAHSIEPAGYGDTAPCCWGWVCCLLCFAWDEVPAGFHPSFATFCCCLMLRASFFKQEQSK